MNNKQKLIILGTILIIAYIMYTTGSNRSNVPSVMWLHRDGDMSPVQRLPELIKEFGQPDFIDPKPNGKAIWLKKTLKNTNGFLERVELRDELIEHDCPEPHYDFLYFYYKLNVPENRVTDLLSISSSVHYDETHKLVRSRCHFSGANYATLNIAMKLVKGELTGYEAKTQYARHVYSTVRGDDLYDPLAEQRYKYELKLYYEDHKTDCFPSEINPDNCRA